MTIKEKDAARPAAQKAERPSWPEQEGLRIIRETFSRTLNEQRKIIGDCLKGSWLTPDQRRLLLVYLREWLPVLEAYLEDRHLLRRDHWGGQ